MENEMYSGSLCLTEIAEQAKNGHSAFTKAANGKIYFNIIIWKNAQADKYGNQISLQLQSVKDKRESENKVYIGNAKLYEKGAGAPLADDDKKSISNVVDDLPF